MNEYIYTYIHTCKYLYIMFIYIIYIKVKVIKKKTYLENVSYV